jgi:ATP-dependent helicase/nuclease subunit B
MSARRPAVFTIPTHVPFLEALAEGLIARFLDPADPASLVRATVLLPTRRAARSLGEHLLAEAKARGLATALLLPEIRPLGDVDEETFLLEAEEGAAPEAVPEILPPLRRRFVIMRLVQAWSAARADPLSAAQSFHLAAELERLMDKADTQGVGLARLHEIVPAELSVHWTDVLAFLEIIRVQWPKIEAEAGAVGPAKRRALLMEAQREDWARHPPEGPVIAAGSTGTIPATASLLRDVARLGQGAVILPGLDRALDEAAWAEIGPSHPQGAMKALLETIGVTRDEVESWPHGRAAAPAFRAQLLNEALRPWPATAAWRDVLATLKAEAASADLGLYRIDAAHQGEEAKAIALILREALETPARVAALVTPDRRLARAVKAELARWAIDVDDSAGLPLSRSAPGIFLQLLAQAAAEKLAPVPLLALLKHPLTGLGLSRSALLRHVHALDREVLRGLRPAPGFAGLFARFAEHDEPALDPFLRRLEEAAAPFLGLFEEAGSVSFARLLEAHLAAAEALARGPEETGADRLWHGDAGEALARLLGEALAEEPFLPQRPPTDYPELFAALIEAAVTRPAFGRHPRLFIWGPLEARLQKADTLVLGGLNEGVWPAEPAADPWMSRGMMEAAGLPPPEQRLGLAAHDFVQSAGSAARVYLTRALKLDGAPAVASRWLMRLETVLGGLDLKDAATPAEPWLAYARALDKPAEPVGPVSPPWPTPPLIARPRRLSVSEIERWIRDPYAIYARHVLGLKVLEALDAPADAALRGQIVHKIVELFAAPDFDPAAQDALARLLANAGSVFEAHRVPAEMRALWMPRFEESARWLIVQECAQREAGERIVATEIKGEITLAVQGGPFVLRGRADRIDRDADGALIISDYKTGKAPTEKEMRAGLAPQLPLEAMMAREGAFGGLAAAPISTLRVIGLMGTAVTAPTNIADAEGLARVVEAELHALIARYDDPAYPYRSRPVPQFMRHEGDYDHLARVKEWSAGGADEEET